MSYGMQSHSRQMGQTRDKKAFLSEQWKEIKENNRIEKTRNLFQKIGVITGTFLGRMGTMKDRNSKDLTEVEEIKKRWLEYTEELYKKVLMIQRTMMVWSLTYNQTSWSVKSSGPRHYYKQS